MRARLASMAMVGLLAAAACGDSVQLGTATDGGVAQGHAADAGARTSSGESTTSTSSSGTSTSSDACAILGSCCHVGETDGSIPISNQDSGIYGMVIDGVGDAPTGRQCLATVAGGDAALCSLVLNALQASEDGPKTEVCGFPSGDSYPFPPPLPRCVALAGCCASLTEPGGTAACDIISGVDYLTPCNLALDHFQAAGFCKSSSGSGS